jgi:hypothetical protein
MSVQISRGEDEQILYCSTTMQAFGPVHTSTEFDLEDFLEYLSLDARTYSSAELAYAYYKWLEKMQEDFETNG